MTDKEYVILMHEIFNEIVSLDPLDHEHWLKHKELLSYVRRLNEKWHRGRRWRLWHFWIKLLGWIIILSVVCWSIIC